MIAYDIAKRLLETDEDEDFDPLGEINRYMTSLIPGVEIVSAFNHWDVYYRAKPGDTLRYALGSIYYDDMTDAPLDDMTPESLQFYETHRWAAVPVKASVEASLHATFDEAVAALAADLIQQESVLDPDDPAPYLQALTRPQLTVHDNPNAPEWKKLRDARGVLRAYYMFQPQERKWYLTLAKGNTIMPFDSEAALMDWAYQKFSPITLEALDESANTWEPELYRDLWKFHPYGVDYDVQDLNQSAYAIARIAFNPNQDNFLHRFGERVKSWFEAKQAFPVKFVKLYTFHHADGHPLCESYSVIAAVNTPWADRHLPDEQRAVEVGHA